MSNASTFAQLLVSGSSNQVASETYVSNAVTTAVNDLINTAPAALDTLDELAAALGDDANFASTVTTALATKADSTDVPDLSVNLVQEGELEVITGTARWYAPYGITVTQTVVRLGTAADGTVGITVNKNGTSANSYALSAGSGGVTDTVNTISMVSGDYLTVDVTSIGTTAKGEDLYIQFIYEKA